ncbi:TetR family transcriptional regulator [Streptomyces sp. SID5914]|nr:TetR/AcrR family transcriptional regulator [Streptomyces sp. SID5914]MZG16361.1 TetR family transcriptional regulator [Streptomyces sp. SID5914]
MPRNRQQVPKAERQSAIVEQAATLFAVRGFRGTSVAEVGRAAGVASAAVHWYFPAKDNLFAAVLREGFTAQRASVEAASDDPRRQLVDFLAGLEPYRALHREAYERIEDSEAVREVYLELQSWLDGRLMAIIADRAPDGADLRLVADTAHLLFEGLLISVRKLDRPVGEVIDMLVALLVAAAS